MSSFASDDEGHTRAISGRTRLAAALAVCATTGLVIAAGASRLSDVTRHAGFVSPGDAFVQLDREITAEFGMGDPIVWVLEARQGTVWSPEILARLQAMTREVFTIPGVIAPDVISLASPNLRDVRASQDGLEQVYLMGEVPKTPAAVAALRQRIEGDPMFHGTLVSLDGRAAMVVANFRAEADPAVVARAALALRDRYCDGQGTVYVTGAPVLRMSALAMVRPVGAWAIAIAVAGGTLLLLTHGAHAALAVLLATMLACIWTAAGLTAAGAVVLPWTAYALLFTAILAAAVVSAGVGRGFARRQQLLMIGLVPGFAGAAVITDAPGRALDVAAAVGAVSAVAAGMVVSALLAVAKADTKPTPWLRPVALALVAVALLGLPRLRTSYGLRGYGERYLPATAVADLRQVVRLFPPPTALVVRVRGAPGFVASPAVLHALDALAQAARADGAVRSAMSLADLIKIVHRAFHDNDNEFFAIPEDPSLAARYLTLAYSPGFRRFVDRGFASSTIWIYLDRDQPQDIKRVFDRLQGQLARHPVPNAQTDLVGGDGAVILVMERTAKHLAAAGVLLLLMVAFAASAFGGRAALRHCVISAGASTVLAGGGFGWFGVPIDLVSLPCLVLAMVAAAAFGALSGTGRAGRLGHLVFVLAGMAALALIAPFTALKLVGVCLLAPAVGAALVLETRDASDALLSVPMAANSR